MITRFMLEMLDWPLGKIGYELRRKGKSKGATVFLSDVNRRLGYDLEDEANANILKVRANTMLPYVKLVTLYQQAVHCERCGIDGSFVECGVWKGGAVALMALANMKHGNQRRHVHLFDAFDDICEPDPTVDGQRALDDIRQYAKGSGPMSGALRPVEGVYDSFGGPGSVADSRRLLEQVVRYDARYIHYHKGWFQDTLPTDSPNLGDIAILRLDGDWYASTKICLDHLYDKVVSGGFVIIDDYALYEGCRKAVDEFREHRKLRVFMSHVDVACRYWIKP